METSTIEIKKEKPDKLESLPKPEYLIDPDAEINIQQLITLTQQDTNFDEQQLLLVFESLASETKGFGLRNDAKSMALFLAEKFALHYRKQGVQDSEAFTSKHIAWSRYAADMGSENATRDLMHHAISYKASNHYMTHWTKDYFNQIYQQFRDSYRHESQESAINKMHTLISEIAISQPKLALNFAFKLMSVLDEKKHYEEADLAKKYFDSLVERHTGVIVLDRIEPTSDRNVQAASERFKALTRVPIALAPIVDLSIFETRLNKEFPWFGALTQKIIQSLRLRQLGRGDFYIQPTLLLGPPGIGKSRYLNLLAKLSGVPIKTISVAGKNDNRDLIGTSRGWGTGSPSMLISLINEHQIGNPIIHLDELDKAGGSDHNGRILDSLLAMFEPSTSGKIYDEYLGGNCNYSHITWICSANDLKRIPTPLLSRLDVVNVDTPSPEHYPRIIESSIKSFCSRNGIHPAHIPTIADADWKWLSKYFKSPRIAKKVAEKWLAYKLLTPELNNLN